MEHLQLSIFFYQNICLLKLQLIRTQIYLAKQCNIVTEKI